MPRYMPRVREMRALIHPAPLSLTERIRNTILRTSRVRGKRKLSPRDIPSPTRQRSTRNYDLENRRGIRNARDQPPGFSPGQKETRAGSQNVNAPFLALSSRERIHEEWSAVVEPRGAGNEINSARSERAMLGMKFVDRSTSDPSEGFSIHERHDRGWRSRRVRGRVLLCAAFIGVSVLYLPTLISYRRARPRSVARLPSHNRGRLARLPRNCERSTETLTAPPNDAASASRWVPRGTARRRERERERWRRRGRGKRRERERERERVGESRAPGPWCS